MKYVIIVDSMASVPDQILNNHENIKVVPMNIVIGSEKFRDPTDNKSLLQFYKNNPLDGESKLEASTPTTDQLLDYMINEIVPHYDVAICQTTTAALSFVFKTFSDCANKIGPEAKIIRDMANIKPPFQMLVVNSSTSSAGQTLLALYTELLVSNDLDLQLCIQKGDEFKQKIKTYAVIKDITYARSRMKHLGFSTIGLTKAVSSKMREISPIVRFKHDTLKPISLKNQYDPAISKVFEYAEKCIESGLYLPYIHISYAGFIKRLYEMNGFKSLQKKAKDNGVTLLTSMMGVAECINYSPGSLSLGIAPVDETTDPA